MKTNRGKKNKSGHALPAREEVAVISFREQLKSKNPEVRDAALHLLRQAEAVILADSKKPRGVLIVADKVEKHGDGTQTIHMEGKKILVKVDDEQSDELVDESAQQIEELHTLLDEMKGPWKFFGDVFDPDNPDQEPRFMFIRDGAILAITNGDRRGPIFAYTREIAKRYVCGFEETYGIKLRIADIQAVGRQPFGSLLAQGSISGANCYFVITPAGHGNATITSVPLKGTFHVLDGWIVPTADTELPKFLITDKGRIWKFDDGKHRGPILVHTREMAEQYVAEGEKRKGTKSSVEESEIPVNALLDMLVNDGMNCACVIRSVADGGEIEWDFIYPVNTPAE